jgi:hypothetical protein
VRAQDKPLGEVRAGLGGTYMAPRHGWRMGASLRGAANGGLAAGAGWQGQGAAPRPKRPASGACGLPGAAPVGVAALLAGGATR